MGDQHWLPMIIWALSLLKKLLRFVDYRLCKKYQYNQNTIFIHAFLSVEALGHRNVNMYGNDYLMNSVNNLVNDTFSFTKRCLWVVIIYKQTIHMNTVDRWIKRGWVPGSPSDNGISKKEVYIFYVKTLKYT